MTKYDAIDKMVEGVKVTHFTFSPDEWATMNEKGDIVTEDGHTHNVFLWWRFREAEAFNSGWEVFEELKQ